MAIEIERKFLVLGDSWRALAHTSGARSSRIRQAYFCRDQRRSVRVRDDAGTITITIKGADGPARQEFEYTVPEADADGLFALCEPGSIDKTRHRVQFGGRLWEIDEFHGPHQGLIVAEVELEQVDAAVTLPDWVGREVTGEAGYTNAALSRARGDWRSE
jgi:adenylate cyclase